MKIAIAHHRASTVATIKQVLHQLPEDLILWTATSEAETLNKCTQNPPELLLLDLALNGVEVVPKVIQHSLCAVLIVTDDLDRNIEKIYQAIGSGAIDAVHTPIAKRGNAEQIAYDLLAKIARVRRVLKSSASRNPPKSRAVTAKKTTPQAPIRQSIQWQANPSSIPLIAIGASTGGPKALAHILTQLPPNFRAAIVIIQHVDAQFSEGFIDWLGQQTALRVRAAVAGDRVQAGTVLVAGTNDHLYLKPSGRLDYTPVPLDYPYRPSIDVFFKSLAQFWQFPATAILLTGMGRDGAQGLQLLRGCGWHTIAQNQDSCVVYGMPKAAVDLNAAVEVLSPRAIATALQRFSRA